MGPIRNPNWSTSGMRATLSYLMLTIFRRVTFYPNTPKCTHIQLEIILFLLVWDVIWIINDLLAPLSLLFQEFQQNSQVLFLQTKSNENNFNPCIIDYAARKSTLIGNKVIKFVFVSNDPNLGRVAYNHEYTHIYIKFRLSKVWWYI